MRCLRRQNARHPERMPTIQRYALAQAGASADAASPDVVTPVCPLSPGKSASFQRGNPSA